MMLDLIALLGETTLATSAAMLLVLLLRRPMRALFGADAAYSLWTLVPITLIAVLLPAPVAPVAMMPMTGVDGPMSAMPTAIARAALPWPGALAALWVLGVLATAALQVWQQRRFQHRLGILRVRAHGLQFSSASIGLPAVNGVLRPRILLPVDFLLRYNVQERRLIVAHEREHIAHGDLPCNALVAVLRCIYWFNPLLHWAAVCYRHDQELACDARVLARHPQARLRYGQAMLKTQLDDLVLPVGCHWHTHPIKERIALLKRPSPRGWQKVVSSGLLLALMAGSGYVAWAQQPAAKQMPAKAPKPPEISGQRSAPGHVSAIASAGAVPIRRAPLPDGMDRPPPSYPVEAAHAGITGKVVVIATFAADGHVTATRIEKSVPAGVFEQVSLDAVRKWKFTAPVKNGKPIGGRMRVPIQFEMDPPSKPILTSGNA